MMFPRVSKAVISLWGIWMIGVGIYTMLEPAIIIQFYAIEPKNAVGWSTLSGNIAPLLLLLGLCALMGIWLSNVTFLWVILLAEAVVLCGRAVALYQHGYHQDLMVTLIAEIAMALWLVIHLRIHHTTHQH
ncbi:hypothetical protein EY643_06820 [Halioglobus maricola]|uniref:DUF4345 domain-containing protein n=1 Tax=Halioglobus maricola TaxID=2601894 RepID=A0A5P9NIN5_9GAMM|nr:hypothetical protein [Halioglobus maricola]QFU75386.1 hypothetical protein EY643_06820 [Halioglobus maricola]